MSITFRKLFNEYRSEYLKLKKNNMVNLKRMLSLKTISWRSFSSNSMRVRKIRGKSKVSLIKRLFILTIFLGSFDSVTKFCIIETSMMSMFSYFFRFCFCRKIYSAGDIYRIFHLNLWF